MWFHGCKNGHGSLKVGIVARSFRAILTTHHVRSTPKVSAAMQLWKHQQQTICEIWYLEEAVGTILQQYSVLKCTWTWSHIGKQTGWWPCIINRLSLGRVCTFKGWGLWLVVGYQCKHPPIWILFTPQTSDDASFSSCHCTVIKVFDVNATGHLLPSGLTCVPISYAGMSVANLIGRFAS